MKTLQSIVTGVMLVVGLGLAPVLMPAPALAWNFPPQSRPPNREALD